MHNKFGGRWTEKKLDIVSKYLSAYTTALKNQPFRTIYVDAFAGNGQILSSDEKGSHWIDGSARIALKNNPRFGKYIFIEKKKKWCQKLKLLKKEFPQIAPDITVIRDDANEVLQKICRTTTWKQPGAQEHRAVVFLDPYGLEVNWSTIQAIAATEAIDLWLLAPLGIGVNRMLPHSGEISEASREGLTAFFGTSDWYSALYKKNPQSSLFPDITPSVVRVSAEEVMDYYTKRLSETFDAVEPTYCVLKNSKNSTLYRLYFAVANKEKRGRMLALKIATSVIENTA